jgi:hypothetical protein
VSAPGCGSPTPPPPLDRATFRPIGQESLSKSPEQSAEKKRPFYIAKNKGASSGTKTPHSSYEEKESTFLVRVKKGETKAKVLFLNYQKSKGWEGPFDMSLTMDEMVEFNAMPAPRAHKWPASVKESESSSGRKRVEDHNALRKGRTRSSQENWTNI